MTYGVEALPLLREEVEDCPATKAKLVLIDEFCELNDKNYNFVCYVKLYFTTEEIIVARRKIWKAQSPAFTFSRVHKIQDTVFKKEAYLTDIITVVDSSKDQKFYYQIHFSGDLKEWFTAFERFSQWHQNRKQKQNDITSAAATNNCKEASMVNGGPRSSRVSSMVLWNRADGQFLNASLRSNSVSSSQDLSSHLVTPVRSNRLSSSSTYKDSVLSCEEDALSSPEPQESSGIDFDSVSINEEGDTSRDEVGKTFSTALEAWTPSSDDYATASSNSNEVQVRPDDDKIRTLDTAVCNKGHSRNKSTSLTRGVKIVTRSDSTVSSAASDPGGPSQAGLAYANLPAVLRSISCDYRSNPSNSFLSSPLRHTQIRGKKVKFSPRQKTFSMLPRDDGSEECLIFENDTQDDSFCSITPENSTPSDNNEDATSTLRPLTPTRSVPTTKQEKGASLAVAQGSTFTLPKRKLVAKLFRRRTASSISDIDDSHMDMESPEPKLLKKKLHQMDPKVLASQLVLLDAEMLRKIKPEELKGGAWVGKNKETRAPNVMKMVQEFNRLALLVPTEILEEKTASARAKVIACFIQIADKCRNLGNYNSLKAILAGLQCTPIYRLKKTWKEVNSRRKKKFEDLSHLMSEEDNWKVYKIELCDTMSKGTCVPFLGQFLTQILQHETVKEVISYRKKSHGRRPQSCEISSSDNRETLSAPTTPVNSDPDDILEASLVVSPTDLNVDFDQTTPTPSNVQPDVSNKESTNDNEDELEHKPTPEEEGIKKESSRTSVIERRDKLSPLPIGKFKRNYVSPTNLYKESLKKSATLQSPQKSGVKSENKDTIDDGDTAGHKLKEAECEVVKTISMESLDSYDGASSCYSRGSTPARDIVPNAPDSEVEDTDYNNVILDVSQVEVNIEDSLDTPTSDFFEKEGTPDVDPFASTPVEDITIETVNTSNEDNPVEGPSVSIEKSPVKDGKMKRRWNSLKRKVSPPKGSGSHNATNSANELTPKKDTGRLRRKLSSPLRSFSSSGCAENATQKKEKGTPRRKQSSPARDDSPSCNIDDTPRRKVKRSLRRKLSSPLRSHHSNLGSNDNDPPQRRDKLHIYHNPDIDGFNAHSMLQEMQFSSMKYMNTLDARPDIQLFIHGLQYNSEEDNYHMSIQMEPIEQHNY